MKRSRIHVTFGLAALGFGLLVAYHGSRLQYAEHVNEAIARANVASLDDTVPEAQFARVLALSKAGEYEAAVKAYKALIQGGRADLRLAALYNLGNLHMHEALKNGPGNVAGSLPLIELAKQNYRDLLRDNPPDWDARYNLERALWLAPEVDEAVAEDNNPAEWEKRVILPAPGFKIELP
jgi:mxaK protein